MTTRFCSAAAQGTGTEAGAALADNLGKALAGDEPQLVLVFASTTQPLADVSSALTARFPNAAVLGASTAGEFTERGDGKQGVVACAISGGLRVNGGIGRGLSADPERAVREAFGNAPGEIEGFPHRSALMLLDPLTGRGEEAVLIAGAMLGADVPLAGGAAGDDLHMKQTHVACGGAVESDAVVLAVVHSSAPFGLGVSHGHRPLSESMKVTRASGSTVFEINGRPAWEVWAEQTRTSADKRGVDPDKLPEDQIGPYLLRYEAGLPAGAELKIRAPLSRGEDGSLGFACAIPEGAELRITESVPEAQIESARRAARQAHAQAGSKLAGAVVFDCICRNLILGDRFGEAVDSISAELGGVPLAGFETYGEIALAAGDMSGFHNTTTVVLAIPE